MKDLAENQLWLPRSVRHNGSNYGEREQFCELAFSSGGPYFQLCMDALPFDIFTCEEDFKTGMNMLAVSVAGCRVVVYNEILMSNHGHLILGGEEAECLIVFSGFKRRLRHFDLSRGYKGRLDDWKASLWPITTLRQMRNEIVYVSRNSYVAIKDTTPTGYPWGSGDLFFNDNLRNYYSVPFNSLPARFRRTVCHSHEIEMPAGYRFGNGMILPSSYVDKAGTEAFFNTANQYFSMLARHAEADVEIARRINEPVVLPDDEMFSTVSSWSLAMYKKGIKELTLSERLELAKRMKYNAASPNGQIARILSFRKTEIDNLFPIRK